MIILILFALISRTHLSSSQNNFYNSNCEERKVSETDDNKDTLTSVIDKNDNVPRHTSIIHRRNVEEDEKLRKLKTDLKKLQEEHDKLQTESDATDKLQNLIDRIEQLSDENCLKSLLLL